jgi:secreted protein with Ig-like and vWFA domain
MTHLILLSFNMDAIVSPRESQSKPDRRKAIEEKFAGMGRKILLCFTDLIHEKDENMALMIGMSASISKEVKLELLTSEQQLSLLDKLLALMDKNGVSIQAAIKLLKEEAPSYRNEYYGAGEVEVMYAALLLEDYLRKQEQA